MKKRLISLIDKKGFFPILTAIVFGLSIYGAYALYYEFSATAEGVDGILYILIGSICLGYFLTLLYHTIFKSKRATKNGVAFILGNIVYQASLWISNAIVNENGTSSELVLAHLFSIVFPVTVIAILVSFVIRAKNSKRATKIVYLLFALVYVAVSVGGFINFNMIRFNRARAEKDIYFDPISAEELMINDEEIQRCRNWYEENLLSIDAVTDLPFDFKIDGKSIKKNADDWTINAGTESDIGAFYKGGKTSYITLRNATEGLTTTIEATIYEANATCEWTIYIKNDGDINSGTISDFYALNHTFKTGKASLYYSNGSDNSPDDFILNEQRVASIKQIFNSDDGRSTDKYLPYFNISGEENGLVLGVGWTGLWEATVDKDGDGTALTVKQENLEAYLLPDEEIRSPLVSICFYNNVNAVKGFNVFRNWIMGCVYPDTIPHTVTMLEVAGPESLASSDEIISTLDTLGDEIYSNIDNLWMDAGWYDYTENWADGVGSWNVDTDRYDNGIIELSSYASDNNLGHVLWYEPERVCKGTDLYNTGIENENWLVEADDYFAMWNLAEEDAFNYLCQYIDASLKENGVTVYRHDFNFSPDVYWTKADEEFYDGRAGICENHYVTNLYRYFDYICRMNEGLIIDNCASGGRRLDLEMTRRSFPAWRSDYNCSYHEDIIEATQSMTYGISFWLPVTGTINYVGSEYEARSAILPSMLDTFGTVGSEYFSEYTAQRELMTGNYFPIENGGYSKENIHAMQYSQPDGTKGEVFIYKRADADYTQFLLRLNGLNPDATYEVYDYDNPEAITRHTGKDLMESGITIPLPEGEKAIIIMFNEAALN